MKQKWLMEFKIDKCLCQYLGTNNNKFNYTIGRIKFKNAEEGQDLSIIIDKNFIYSKQCCTAVKKQIKFYDY